ncbi:hypothetical protein BB934_45290 (plasmid) [Microvirga ossetica]|uniref:Uncharacterized protein n=1 Tax=Microvirga ossetica TaxID=1882682 RepID=A0A1B2EZP6_9HYPH|nr:hypothetical protein [Microvirga ossetica]ANY85436.1 hypothetical protein BB934_45290 [Microvirga ossetica]
MIEILHDVRVGATSRLSSSWRGWVALAALTPASSYSPDPQGRLKSEFRLAPLYRLSVRSFRAEIMNSDLHQLLFKTLSFRSTKTVGSVVTQHKEEYDLFFNHAGDPIIVRWKELKRLQDGDKPRIIAANLKAQHLFRQSLRGLEGLKGYREIDDQVWLDTALKLLKAFMPKRDTLDPPFYGALTDTNTNETRFGTVPYPHGRPKHHWHVLSSFEKRTVVTWKTLSSISRRENRAEDRLNDEDIELINLWTNDSDEKLTRDEVDKWSDYSQTLPRFKRYIYARMAEKFVADFYRYQLGVSAVDVSILQVSGRDVRWKTHDIEADTLIDVKNATVFTSNRRRHNYVDKFKAVAGVDVAIAGVLTDGSGPDREKGIRQTLLGLVTRRDVQESTDAVNTLPDRLFPVTVHYDTGYIPAWAFEIEAYTPDYTVLYEWAAILARKPETIMALAIACGRHQECDVYQVLSQSQRDLVDRFALAVSRSSYRKLTIALFALSEFMHSVVRGENGAAVIRFIRRMISVENFTDWIRREPAQGSSGSGPFERRHVFKIMEYEIDVDCPGGDSGALYDPTGSLSDLLKMLEECGERIALSGINFRHFDAPSPYMLLGKTDRGEKLTIYTYCGGKSKSGFRCDNFPLTLVKHPNCQTCGRLVCNECGYCSERCEERFKRKRPDDDAD